ncbi:MAG: polysaccharide biosynthesis C-terminal domain-containing protein, partial [Oscillospiraceae bacterium]|nr:polysaccharide biosynthesis C-terminal domain-containing protein [Oscillospiraceae bacterium]
GAVVALIGWMLTPMLLRTIIRVSDEVVFEYAVLYMRIYCIGLPFQFLYNACASALRGVGDSKASLIFLLVSSAVNVLLDLLLIVVFTMGVTGAAIATVISQAVCAAVSYGYLRKKFPRAKGAKVFDAKLALTVTKIGLPTSIQQGVVSFGNITLMRLVHHFAAIGTTGIVEAYTAGSRIDMFAFVPIMGFQSALASFTGQNIAAGRLDRVKRGYFLTLAYGVGTTLAICLLMYFLADPLVSLFSLRGDALVYGAEQIRYYSKTIWVFALYMVLGGVLQGAGDTLFQSAATLSSLAVRVALSYIGVFAASWFGYEAAWSTLIYGWIIALLTTNIRFYTGGWMKKAIARRKT